MPRGVYPARVSVLPLLLVVGLSWARWVSAAHAQPAGPPTVRFAVAKFENRDQAPSLDWMVAGAPFEFGEKTEEIMPMIGAWGPLVVPATTVIDTSESVVVFANAANAQWVVTGWGARPQGRLLVGVSIWRVRDGKARIVVEDARTGDPTAYHAMLGELAVALWTEARRLVPGELPALAPNASTIFARPWATDHYAVTLVGRALGLMSGALRVDLPAAEADIRKALLIAPDMAEAHRLRAELVMRQAALAASTPALAREANEMAYGILARALELRPRYLAALRAASQLASVLALWEDAATHNAQLVIMEPWNIDARLAWGVALRHSKQPQAASEQLRMVVARLPENILARRELALAWSALGNVAAEQAEWEQVLRLAPHDTVANDELARVYASLGRWPDAQRLLATLAELMPQEGRVWLRLAHAAKQTRDRALLEHALGAAQRLPLTQSVAAFGLAMVPVDANEPLLALPRLSALLRDRELSPVAHYTLGVLALQQGRAREALPWLRQAAYAAPDERLTQQAYVAALLRAGQPGMAVTYLSSAFRTWPDDAWLRYLEAHATSQLGDVARARAALAVASGLPPGVVSRALNELARGQRFELAFEPSWWRYWGDAPMLEAALEAWTQTHAAATSHATNFHRAAYGILGELGRAPWAQGQRASEACPLRRLAPPWMEGGRELAEHARLAQRGAAIMKLLERHERVGLGDGLSPASRDRLGVAKIAQRRLSAARRELQSEWVRGVLPELKAAKCTDALLSAAFAEPSAFPVTRGTAAAVPNTASVLEPPPSVTFSVDNRACDQGGTVWVDGEELGNVAGGSRVTFSAPAGEHSVCILVGGLARCGDRGTLRQVYLRDGWEVTLKCPWR